MKFLKLSTLLLPFLLVVAPTQKVNAMDRMERSEGARNLLAAMLVGSTGYGLCRLGSLLNKSWTKEVIQITGRTPILPDPMGVLCIAAGAGLILLGSGAAIYQLFPNIK